MVYHYDPNGDIVYALLHDFWNHPAWKRIHQWDVPLIYPLLRQVSVCSGSPYYTLSWSSQRNDDHEVCKQLVRKLCRVWLRNFFRHWIFLSHASNCCWVYQHLPASVPAYHLAFYYSFCCPRSYYGALNHLFRISYGQQIEGYHAPSSKIRETLQRHQIWN